MQWEIEGKVVVATAAGAAAGLALAFYEEFVAGQTHRWAEFFALMYLGAFAAFLAHVAMMAFFGSTDLAATTAAGFLARHFLRVLDTIGGRWLEDKAKDLWKR